MNVNMNASLAVPVTHNDATKYIAVEDAALDSFLARCLHAFSMATQQPQPHQQNLSLVFETVPTHLNADVSAAVITTDLALRLVLGASTKTGRLLLNHSHNLPSIDHSIHTVLKAVADTAVAHSEAASIFVALSTNMGSRTNHHNPNHNHNHNNHNSHNSHNNHNNLNSKDDAMIPTCTSSSSSASSPASTPLATSANHVPPIDLYHNNTNPNTNLNNHHPHSNTNYTSNAAMSNNASADDLFGGLDDDELSNQVRVLSCFCTHTGVACSECHVNPIMGTRYTPYTEASASKSNLTLNLCESCRRKMGNSNSSSACNHEYVVYDHPWESCEEYRLEDDLKTPKPPLKQGDKGPKVLHLHYILYKIGYLSLARPWFQPGVYCSNTSKVIGQLQVDHNVAIHNSEHTDFGVYSMVTRSIMLRLLEDQDAITASLRCSSLSDVAEPPSNTTGNNSLHMRMALAA